MDPRKARRIAAIALVAGVVGDLLFDRTGMGINVPLGVAGGLIAVWLVGSGRPIDRLDWWIPVVAMLAAVGVAIRADAPVVLADSALAAAGLVAWALAVSVGGLTRRSAAVVMALGAEAGVMIGLGAAVVLDRAARQPSDASGAASWRRALPVVRGLLIAVPVLAIFAGLLGSADAAFAGIIDGLLSLGINVDELVRRGIVVAIVAWPTAGGLAVAAGAFPSVFTSLVRALVPPPAEAPQVVPAGWAAPAPVPVQVRLPGAASTEALTVLVAVEVLFAAFVVVQVAYLFGGFATMTRAGLTYSEYARAGFFQLVAVVAGAGLLLLAGHALAGRAKEFLPVAVGLVVLTGVILASAAVRLGLYQQAYGWSELRFYVAATIGWLGICLLIALVLVIRREAGWLLHGVAGAAIAVALLVTALGPQSFIAGQNVARALDPSLVPAGGKAGLDIDYVSTLGDGAVPVLVDALPLLAPADRARLLLSLREQRFALEADQSPGAWPGWNLDRERARDALRGLPAS